MPRRRPHKRRYNEPGHAHELTFSCYHRFQFLRAERTCNWLCDSIAAARINLNFDLWAFVFMPEHVHLIVHPRKPIYDTADICEAIKEPVGRNAVNFLRNEAPDWLRRIEVVKG